MDRGIPTKPCWRSCGHAGGQYLVGTPKGRLTKLEQPLLTVPWQAARPPSAGEAACAWTQSSTSGCRARPAWPRSGRCAGAASSGSGAAPPGLAAATADLRDAPLEAGGGPADSRRMQALVMVTLPPPPPSPTGSGGSVFTFRLDTAKLRQVRRRRGRYLLRSNLTATDPAQLWEYYTCTWWRFQRCHRTLKDELAVRPIYHQRPERVEAHIFVAFLAYCLHVALKAQLQPHAAALSVQQDAEQVRHNVNARCPLPDDRQTAGS